jgi:beta-lactamase class A
VQGQRVGGHSIASAATALDKKYVGATATIKTDAKTFTGSLTDVGVSIDAIQSARNAAQYPLWQRLVPFSSVFIVIGRNTPMQASFNSTKVNTFAANVHNEGHSEATDASLIVKKGKVTLVPSVPSKDYSAASVAAAIEHTHFGPRTAVAVTPQTASASLTDAEAENAKEHAQKLIDAKLVLTLQGKQIGVKAKTSGGWLTFSANAAADDLDIGVQASAVRKYLETIQGDVYKAPGTTHIQLIDDREVGRTTGAAGRGIDMDKATAAIESAIKKSGEDTVTLPVGDLSPTEMYDKKYSNTDKELASLLSTIAADKGGYGISLMELGGRSANANGNKQFVAASTYKLFVAYAVFKEIEAGRMSWSDTINAGRSAATCFDDMIVVSDNDCPVAFGHLIGWSKINTTVHNLGLSSKTQVGPPMYTTPNDLAYFLYRIQNGSLLSSADKDRLISAMKRQHYTRAGIPSGVDGTVADKVGDVDGYLHDAAIVYGSRKTYVLVIMTFGSSWPGIADAANQIDNYLN